MANILVIEDQDSLGSLYQRVLGSIGHGVTIAQTGLAAIVAVETRKPDMVFLDLLLPGMKATEVVDRLTRLGVLPDSPLVLSSAMAQSKLAALARNLGANHILPNTLRHKVAIKLGEFPLAKNQGVTDRSLRGVHIALGRLS